MFFFIILAPGSKTNLYVHFCLNENIGPTDTVRTVIVNRECTLNRESARRQ